TRPAARAPWRRTSRPRRAPRRRRRAQGARPPSHRRPRKVGSWQWCRSCVFSEFGDEPRRRGMGTQFAPRDAIEQRGDAALAVMQEAVAQDLLAGPQEAPLVDRGAARGDLARRLERPAVAVDRGEDFADALVA